MSTPNPKPIANAATTPKPETPPSKDPSPPTPKSNKLTVSASAKTRFELMLRSLNDALEDRGFEISSREFLDHIIANHSEHSRYVMYSEATGFQVTLKTSVQIAGADGTPVLRDFSSQRNSPAGFPPNSWGVAREPAAPKGTPPSSNRTTSKTESKPVDPPGAEVPVAEKDLGQSKLEL